MLDSRFPVITWLTRLGISAISLRDCAGQPARIHELGQDFLKRWHSTMSGQNWGRSIPLLMVGSVLVKCESALPQNRDFGRNPVELLMRREIKKAVKSTS